MKKDSAIKKQRGRVAKAFTERIAKMSANDRALLVAGLNALLATQDGDIPNNLRVDPQTFDIYAICPVKSEYVSMGIVKMMRPVLSALKSATRRSV